MDTSHAFSLDRRPFPPLFLSHGSPMMALEPGPAGRFLQQLGRTLDRHHGRPRAVLAISAHSLARQPVLLGATQHATVHDFGGFDPALYEMRYDAAGAPALAQALAAASDGHLALSPEGGLDHGNWVPLRYLYPEVDVPVLPLAFSPHATPAALFELGRLLADLLPPDVLLMASGSMTHNLRLVFRGNAAVDAEEIPASRAFRDWMQQKASAQDWRTLLDYRRQAPHAVDMHPTDEHLLPWFIAAGAGSLAPAPALRLHGSVSHGCLGMDAYAFGVEAEGLAQALRSDTAA